MYQIVSFPNGFRRSGRELRLIVVEAWLRGRSGGRSVCHPEGPAGKVQASAPPKLGAPSRSFIEWQISYVTGCVETPFWGQSYMRRLVTEIVPSLIRPGIVSANKMKLCKFPHVLRDRALTAWGRRKNLLGRRASPPEAKSGGFLLNASNRVFS